MSDADALVCAIGGQQRLEIAVVRGDLVTRWFTLNEDPPVAAIILFAQRGLGDGNMALVESEADRPPEPVGPRIKFEDDATPCLRWRIVGASGDEVSKSQSVVRLREGEHPPDGLTRSLATPVRLPDRLEPEDRKALKLRTAGLGRPAFTATLTLERMAFSRREYLTADGILRHEATVVGLTEVRIPWDGADASMSTAFEPWVPRPTSIARVRGERAMATLGHLGDVALIEVQSRSGAIWYSVLGDAAKLTDALALGIEHSESGVPLWVSAFAAPPALPSVPVIGNGTCTVRTVTTVVGPSDVAGSPDITAAAANHFALSGRQHLRLPELDSRITGSVATSFRTAAIDLNGGLPKPRVATFALHVEEQWSTPYGEVAVSYDVDPRGAFSGITTIDARDRSQVGYACRSRHVASRLNRCPYCQTDTCGGCLDGVEPCALCAFPICDGCAQVASGVPHLCPACCSLQKVGWYSRRKLVDAEFRDARGVTGADAAHRVAFAVDDNRVRITSEQPGAPPQVWVVPPNPALAARINEAYGKALLHHPQPPTTRS